MAAKSLLHPLLLQPHNNAILDNLEREQRDAMVRAIAARMVGAPRSKRRTRIELRPLAWPVWVGDLLCSCAVTERFVMSNPREHVAQTTWFESTEAALVAYPGARLVDDAPSVIPRLEARA